MKNRLRITFKNQLRALKGFFLFFIAYIIISRYLYSDLTQEINTIDIIGFLIFCFPAIVLQIDYYIRNKNEEYELANDKIIYRKKGVEKIYKKEDIKKIVIYMSPNYFNDRMQVTGFENYHFAKVFLKSGQVLYITNLLTPVVAEALSVYLEDIPYRREKRFFVSTLW